MTVGSGRSGGAVGEAFSFLFAKVSNFIQKAIVFWGTGVTSSANTFVTVCFTERYTEAPPDLPEGGGGDKFASILQKNIWEKSQESLSSRVRIGTPLLSEGSGEAVEVG